MKFFLLLFSFSILFITCKKDTFKNYNDENSLNVRENTLRAFFKLNHDASRDIKLIANNIESAEFQSPFLVNFTKKNGFPVWSKMIGNTSSANATDAIQNRIKSNGTTSNFTETNTSLGFFLLPLIDTTTKEVTAYIAIEKRNDSSYIYKTYNKRDILKTTPLTDSQKVNSKPLLGVFAFFEKTINGKIKSTFKGSSIAYDFNNVTLRKASTQDTNYLKANSSPSYKSNVIPTGCIRAILDWYYVDYGDGSWDLLIILSDCLTLPGVVVTSTIPGASGGYSGGYTGPISGNPFYGGGYSSGNGGSSGGSSGGGGSNNGGGGTRSPNGFEQDPWQVFWASLSSYTATNYAALNILRNTLALNEVELVWLNNNPTIINELNNFLSSNNSQESIEIAWQHLNTLMNDAAYYDFVINYQSNNSGQGVWWENDNFISNPVNISFDADPIDGILKSLNAAEKALVKKYPICAIRIDNNRQVAWAATENLYGVNGRNDKSDAFRHAYWNAMNERDCRYLRGSGIAKLFSDAHESATPAHLIKESEMDFHNNDVGQLIGYGLNFLYSNDTLVSDVMAKMLSGELVYLSPIWYGDPNFANTGGILPSTVLKPSNQ